MCVQQLSGMVHSVYGQAHKVAPQQTVEVDREEFTLHKTEGVTADLLHQGKT